MGSGLQTFKNYVSDIFATVILPLIVKLRVAFVSLVKFHMQFIFLFIAIGAVQISHKHKTLKYNGFRY